MASRPEEFIWWFRYARPNVTPEIESVGDFEDNWVQWWSSIQPEWRRGTGDLPFVQEDATGQQDWGKLPTGGKDGLFLVVISLGWWIHVRGLSSKVNDAIADVTWVIDNLNTFLSTGATFNSDPDSDSDSDPIPPPPSQKKRPKRGKVGPPPKRTRRTKRARS